jgi:hypothetical protein
MDAQSGSAPEHRPYAPSWLDRIQDGVRRLPVPYPVIYLVAGLLLGLGRNIVGWVDGSYPVGTFFRVHVLDGLFPLYFAFVIHLLDDMAGHALSDYRAKLTANATFEQLHFRLTTMPAVASLLIGIAAFTVGALYEFVLFSPTDIQVSKYFTSPTATVIDSALSGLSGLMMIMFAFHTIHQLRTISRIYTENTKVSIFDIGALYALSRVTAVTALALLLFSYVYIAVYSGGQIYSVSNAIVLGIILLVAVLTFVVPLWGAHRLLQREKSHRLSEAGRRLEAASDSLHDRVDAIDYSDEADHIRSAIDALIQERGVITKASTWPWEPEAVRAVITAVLLPIVIWIVTQILAKFVF